MRNYGFTGGRRGLTDPQLRTFKEVLTPEDDEIEPGIFRHGSCIGADDKCGWIAHQLGYRIVLHPPSDPRFRAYSYYDEIREEQSYLVRNMSIVLSCDELIACPNQSNEVVRSGTWATIRYARRQQRKVMLVLPTGAVRIIEPEKE